MSAPDFGDQHAPAAPAAHAAPDFGDRPAAATSTTDDWLHAGGRLLGSTAATAIGAEKGLVQSFGNAPWGSIPNEDGKSPVLNWAKSENKDYPWAEGAGRLAGEYGPLAALPESGAGKAIEASMSDLPRLARVIGKGVEGTWKGAVGGTTQGDAATGGDVGGGAATAYSAYRMLPHQAQWMLPIAAIWGASKAADQGYLHWEPRHILAYLAEAAAALGGKFPGVGGALGAKAFGSGDQR
jgi:hypothetical protein